MAYSRTASCRNAAYSSPWEIPCSKEAGHHLTLVVSVHWARLERSSRLTGSRFTGLSSMTHCMTQASGVNSYSDTSVIPSRFQTYLLVSDQWHFGPTDMDWLRSQTRGIYCDSSVFSRLPPFPDLPSRQASSQCSMEGADSVWLHSLGMHQLLLRPGLPATPTRGVF